MIKVENIDCWGFDHAIRGMRNPLNSWEKSDSHMLGDLCFIGSNDLDLIKRLYKAGPEHRKYLRQIFVSMDIVAPLYWWKEFDTYKVGTVANSCSTMHKIHAKEFTSDDFSCEHLIVNGAKTELFAGDKDTGVLVSPGNLLNIIIVCLNYCRKMYLETKDKQWWWQMIQLLPTSYNQRRTITMNYENVISIIKQRKDHKLNEWNEFVEVLTDLPYIKEITQ